MRIPDFPEGARFRIEAPAKLNLRLKVTGRLSDGYHLLEMVNVPIDLCDILEISLHHEPRIELAVHGIQEGSNGERLNDVQNNIVTKAIVLFQEIMLLSFGTTVTLQKHIPVGAGLGGGSSNAASVLKGLYNFLLAEKNEEVWGELVHTSVRLGADVPYFLKGGCAHVSGIGENVEPLQGAFLDGCPALLVVPEVSLSTKKVYDTFTKSVRAFSPSTIENTKKLFVSGGAVSLIENDLFDAACVIEPSLARVRSDLGTINGCIVSMTGSGSTFFVLPNNLKSFEGNTVHKIEEVSKALRARIISTRISISNGDC